MRETRTMVEVTLLTQADCAFCDEAKEILERLSAEYDLNIREVDLRTREGERLAAGGGVMFPPGILLDGAAFSYGRPSERRLRRALAALAHPSSE